MAQDHHLFSYSSGSEHISPIILGGREDTDDDDGEFSQSRTKQHRKSTTRRLSDRHARLTESSLLLPVTETKSPDSPSRDKHPAANANLQDCDSPSFLQQVAAWLEEEKAKSNARRARRYAVKSGNATIPREGKRRQTTGGARRPSDASESALALGKLEVIIEKALTFAAKPKGSGPKSSHTAHKTSSYRKLKRHPTNVSSDTDFQDGEPIVPSCDGWLDNTKTLSYTGGTAGSSDVLELSRPKTKESEAWDAFKYEILRLTHTLHIRGWWRVPLECSREIDVERLSGALTNAIYVVSPPRDLTVLNPPSRMTILRPKKPPSKLLLRIYGPNVSHLIDRDSELAILRRLARKRIGPRLLGTFRNGRFEEYFHARPLTPQELRNPETSTQIAKRMRELHDGIALEKHEITAGPFVWQNWDKWVARCEKIITWLDRQLLKTQKASSASACGQYKSAFVCGVEWKQFREAVEKYREWLDVQCGGSDQIKRRLVFAHNDTQYGNILRYVPQGDSPLLLPANEHKQLVVIDFEYANANVPGLEFANHFTEWCYNYHDDHSPYTLNHWVYPSTSEQRRFLRSYVYHQPQFSFASSATDTPHLGAATAGNTPVSTGDTSIAAPTTPGLTAASPRTSALPPTLLRTSTSNMSMFTLDVRGPLESSSHAPDSQRPSEWDKVQETAKESAEEEVNKLLHETRLWRAANSAQWVAWAIVQARLPRPLAREMERWLADAPNCPVSGATPSFTPMSASFEQSPTPNGATEAPAESLETDDSEGDAEGEAEEFDYLAYAHERALFFWGDVLQAGIIGEEELPEELRARVKRVEH
ncbi:MAG: hypothetical protein Q9165_002688 [Trypethelium subeluteriae]